MASDTGTGYLLPVDADPEDLAGTAYPLQRLHANLGQAGARTIMLMLEATFSDTVTDVVDAPNLPEMDVILLRNVLLYFGEDTRHDVLRKAQEKLRPGGTLFLGAAEATFPGEQYERTRCGRTSFYRVRGVEV